MKHCFASYDPDHYYFHFHRRYKWTAKVSKPLSSHRIDEECELDAHQTKDRVSGTGGQEEQFDPVGSVGSAGDLREESGVELNLIVKWSFKDRTGTRFPELTLRVGTSTCTQGTYC